jgi:SAM-dependent methyltransferase|tara:strand:- start:261 stop:1217 length:957 start_codon:yes stop_codon:yes gene_type:complete
MVLLLAAQQLVAPMALAPRAGAVSMVSVCELEFAGRLTRDLLLFDTMLRAKPYPYDCPYDCDSLFAAREPLDVQVAPSRDESEVIRRLYTQRLRDQPNEPERVLEVLCDGHSLLPKKPSLRASFVHLCEGSYRIGSEEAPSADHKLAALDDALPFADNTFDAVFVHGVVPYLPDPLHTFSELSRVLRPSGAVTVSWVGFGNQAATNGWENPARNAARIDETYASSAWLHASDTAELLYMTGSFFRYTGEWQKLRLEEAAARSVQRQPSRILAVTAVKQSLRASQLQRVQDDLTRSRQTHSSHMSDPILPMYISDLVCL